MKTLNYSSKTWHAKLYKSTYAEDTCPDNICEYFWLLVLAIIMIIPAHLGHIGNIVKRKNSFHAVGATIIAILILVIGAACYHTKLDKHIHVSFWLIYGTGLMIMLGISLLIWGIVSIMSWYEDRPQKDKKPKQPNPIIAGFRAFKGKYCSKINWD